jgi:NADH-quinone oxidoreductase subunit E
LAQNKVTQYRQKQSAILFLFDLAQRQNDGWLSRSAMEYVADYVGVSYVKALEIASFYSMFNLQAVGKYHLQVCGTTPCWLNGAGQLTADLSAELGIKPGQTTQDGIFTLSEVECLGACINAPVVQVNDQYHENVTDARAFIAGLRAKK